jgi:hypothetical protein
MALLLKSSNGFAKAEIFEKIVRILLMILLNESYCGFKVH